jgi:hypothetical protein
MEENQTSRPSGEREVIWTSARFYEWLDEKIDLVLAPPFLPKETREHLFNARREAMLAMRSLVDRSLSRMEEAQKRRDSEDQGPTKIKVE